MRIWLMLHRWHKAALSFMHYNIGLTYRYWGNTYSLQSEYEKAMDHFNQALEHKPDYAKVYLNRGILYWRELDRPRRAIDDLTQALALDPGMDEALFNRGVAYQQLKEYEKAIADYKAYLQNSDHPYWQEYAANMIHELGEWTDGDATLITGQ
ncbi:MAG: tetratricopeptide repeat protein [Anaerolineales bacterium]|nr:MAG: tetratricopeptide repeat protein [Anaerolineales bacterium]